MANTMVNSDSIEEENPWRGWALQFGGWALRLWDAAGFTELDCCQEMGTGCLCEHCMALLTRGEAEKVIESCTNTINALRTQRARRERRERHRERRRTRQLARRGRRWTMLSRDEDKENKAYNETR